MAARNAAALAADPRGGRLGYPSCAAVIPRSETRSGIHLDPPPEHTRLRTLASKAFTAAVATSANDRRRAHSARSSSSYHVPFRSADCSGVGAASVLRPCLARHLRRVMCQRRYGASRGSDRRFSEAVLDTIANLARIASGQKPRESPSAHETVAAHRHAVTIRRPRV
jgi:hypothetical protein